jgi:hypothetical protein
MAPPIFWGTQMVCGGWLQHCRISLVPVCLSSYAAVSQPDIQPHTYCRQRHKCVIWTHCAGRPEPVAPRLSHALVLNADCQHHHAAWPCLIICISQPTSAPTADRAPGQQPIIPPSSCFQYFSGAQLTNSSDSQEVPSGSMKGVLLVDLYADNGLATERVQVPVGPFKLMAPPKAWQ